MLVRVKVVIYRRCMDDGGMGMGRSSILEAFMSGKWLLDINCFVGYWIQRTPRLDDRMVACGMVVLGIVGREWQFWECAWGLNGMIRYHLHAVGKEG